MAGAYESGQYNSRMGGGYIDPSDKGAENLKQMMDYFYQSNYTGQSALWAQGLIDKRFKAGDQALYSMMYGQNYQQYQKFFFNLIRRHLNMIGGFQRRNRKSTITQPVHQGDDALSDDYNAVLRYCEDRDGFQEYLSESFEGACDTGMTLMHMYMDYSRDPYSGDLFTDCVSYNNFLIDQYFRKQDLSDCNGIWRRRWTSKQGAKLLLPGYAEEIDKMSSGGMKDGRFPVQAELQNIPVNGLFAYDEFYYRSTREATMILDPMSGEAVEWIDEPDAVEGEMEQALRMQPWLQVKKMQVPTVKLVIQLGSKIVYHGQNQLGIDSYPFVPSMCYYEPDIPSYAWRVQGIVRNLRDSQFLYNMRKIIELQMLQSSVNAGWIYSVDSVVDEKAFRQAGADGYLIALKQGHTPAEVQRIEPVAIPPSLIELSRILADDITKISGVNEELLGAATDDKAGILAMLRQGAGLTTLQGIFDKLDYTQRLYGQIRLEAICKNFSKQKIKNILGKDPDQRFFSYEAKKYGIVVEEGNYSATQRQNELQQLLHFREIGMPIPDESIMDAAFITNKAKIIEQMQAANQQAQQQQQQQAQQQEKSDNSKMMLDFAKSKSELAREKDLMASAQQKIASIGESSANAEYKRSESDLNLVKMMMELEDQQFGQFKSALEYAQMVKEYNSLNQQPAAVGG
mgnify:CR=1 FL=1